MSFLNYFIRIFHVLKQMNTHFFRSIKSISVLYYQLKFSQVIGDVITFTCVELFLFESVSERRTNFIFTCVLLHVLYINARTSMTSDFPLSEMFIINLKKNRNYRQCTYCGTCTYYGTLFYLRNVCKMYSVPIMDSCTFACSIIGTPDVP